MASEVKKGSELRQRYVISDLLGVGGYAAVWRATDKQEGRDVAIKRLLKTRGNELARILDEAKQTAKVRGHKNIVEMYEVFEEDSEGFLVMEYVDGRTLDDLIKQHILKSSWFDRDEALDIFRQVLQGLLFAHSSGLYHRDVKPSNILVSKLGVVKLVDFGIAMPMVARSEEMADRHPGVAWTGTPNFMSPEQANGESLDHQTDIFSAGLIGYILLTGRHPFNHPSGVASVFELIREPSFDCTELPPEMAKHLPEGIPNTLMRMLRKEKSSRFQSLIGPLGELTKEAAQSCPQCGSPNPMSNSFCGQCGHSLKVSIGLDVPSKTPPATPKKPASAEELTDEGFGLTRDGDWEGAVLKYKEAIKLDPSYARAYSNLGFALNRLGNHEDAIEVLTKGEAVTGDNVLLHRILDARGFAKSIMKDYEGAMEDFSEALKHVGTNPRVYCHRAESEALTNRFDEAYNDIIIALRLDPDFAPAIRLKQKLEAQGYVRSLGSARSYQR